MPITDRSEYLVSPSGSTGHPLKNQKQIEPPRRQDAKKNKQESFFPWRLGALAIHLFCICGVLKAAVPTPNLESNIDRPLRYLPDQGDFVIYNGTEWFNRPLYGSNT